MDRYDVVRAIGEGATAECFLVRERHTRQLFAMKVVQACPRDPMREVRVQSSCSHPNVIRLHDHFYSPSGQLCIIVEFADGGDLEAVLHACRRARKMLDEDVVLDWFLQLCLAVHYCHRQNLIHRDLKLQNIFITSSGVVKLGDFGVSREVAPDPNLAMTHIGTPFYLSPEIFRRQPYDLKSDIWSMGVVLYELMSLHRPFHADGLLSLQQEVLALRYDPLPECFSDELCSLVTGMLQLDPAKRPSTEALLHSKPLRRRYRQWLHSAGGVTVPQQYIQAVVAMGPLSGLKPTAAASPPKCHQQRAAWFPGGDATPADGAAEGGVAPSPLTGPASHHSVACGDFDVNPPDSPRRASRPNPAPRPVLQGPLPALRLNLSRLADPPAAPRPSRFSLGPEDDAALPPPAADPDTARPSSRRCGSLAAGAAPPVSERWGSSVRRGTLKPLIHGPRLESFVLSDVGDLSPPRPPSEPASAQSGTESRTPPSPSCDFVPLTALPPIRPVHVVPEPRQSCLNGEERHSDEPNTLEPPSPLSSVCAVAC